MPNRNGLDRRTFLRGAGVALCLPWLECFSANGQEQPAPPKRFLALYVGHGFAITLRDDHPAREWSWYPIVRDGRMIFGRSMAGFNQFRDKVTVLHGLEHPRCIRANGHGTADSFLTGSNISDPVRSPSIDQVAALAHGRNTRYPSLVLGNEGGLGTNGVSKTLSYDRFGRPIPATNDLRLLFNNMFSSDPTVARRDTQRLAAERRLVDRVLESHRDLRRRVGRADSQRLDEYLDSVRGVESEIERMERWSRTPRPRVNANELALNATVRDPAAFIRTMYNLIFLAFQTDTTRYATYMLLSMGGGEWNNVPQIALGLRGNHHSLAHSAAGASPRAMEALGTYDRFQSDLLTAFIRRLDQTREADGSTMLDNTIVFYGTSNSRTHVNRDYPLLLCGGSNLGLRHGRFIKLGPHAPPLSNLYVTLLNLLGVPTRRFSDSTGALAGLT